MSSSFSAVVFFFGGFLGFSRFGRRRFLVAPFFFVSTRAFQKISDDDKLPFSFAAFFLASNWATKIKHLPDPGTCIGEMVIN